MEGGGKKRISDTRGKRIRREITKDLAAYDLAEWQKACKGFGPIHNDHETRREYFETNRFRLEAAREIVDFVGVWEEHLKSDFESEPRTDIRKRIIAAIRAAQRKKKMELGLLNAVKLSGFKTLIKWADNPRELAKQRLYRSREKTKKLQGTPTNGRRERMKTLGQYQPPRVELDNDYHMLSKDSILLTITVSNTFIHPYQNVELGINLDPRLKVREVSPYAWGPKLGRIKIGFLEASLETVSKVATVKLHISILEPADEYSIGGKIIYDDCEQGRQVEIELEQVKLTF